MKLKLKRLIIINILLFSLYNKIPTYNNQLSNTNEVENLAQTQQIISSRSLTESRVEQQMEETKPEYVKPTIYSENLYQFVKSKEGFKSEAYLMEGETYYTIGYGHHGKDVKSGQTITEEEADRMLRADLKGVSDYVLQHCDYFEINQNQLDALTSFAFNGGVGMLQQLTNHKQRTPEEIAEHITAYTKSSSESFRRGLTNRRTEEKQIFLGGF